MPYAVRADQRSKILLYLGEQSAAEGLRTLCVDRLVGKGVYRQIGDGYEPSELEALSDPEAILDAALEAKAKGIGRWRFRAWFGEEQTAPECRFETVSDTPSEIKAPDSSGAAMRDLASQLRQNADMMGNRLEGTLDKLGANQSSFLEAVLGLTQREAANVGQRDAALLTISVELATTRAENKRLEDEIERIKADNAAGFVTALLGRVPPEAMGAAVVGLTGVVAELAKVGVEWVRARSGQPQGVLPAPQDPAPGGSPGMAASTEPSPVSP